MGREMDDEEYEAFDPEVLSTIPSGFSNPHDPRTRVQWWAYQMQANGHLASDRMRIPPEGIIRFPGPFTYILRSTMLLMDSRFIYSSTYSFTLSL